MINSYHNTAENLLTETKGAGTVSSRYRELAVKCQFSVEE